MIDILFNKKKAFKLFNYEHFPDWHDKPNVKSHSSLLTHTPFNEFLETIN